MTRVVWRINRQPSGDHGSAVGLAVDAVPVVSSRDLMGTGRLVVIRHGTEDYRLQVTGSGKLILTK
jgi:hemin uptake protein HemP